MDFKVISCGIAPFQTFDTENVVLISQVCLACMNGGAGSKRYLLLKP